MFKPSNNFRLIPLNQIVVPERPDEDATDGPLFFNPRRIESFRKDQMQDLYTSIKTTGLQQPPVVRIFTKDGTSEGEIEEIQLIAGERRYRTLCKLIKNNEQVYCNLTGDLRPAVDVYGSVSCGVHYNLPDDRALKIAFEENDKHKSLTLGEEIYLVERLSASGKTQVEIAEILGVHQTWVSQTVNFRKELPEDVFEDLCDGDITRAVAQEIKKTNKQDRVQVYEAASRIAEEERVAALSEIEDEIYLAEDYKNMMAAEYDEAKEKGDSSQMKKAEKTLQKLEKETQVKEEQKAKLENQEKPTITTEHVKKAAAENEGVECGENTAVVNQQETSEKQKSLGRLQIEKYYVEFLEIVLSEIEATGEYQGQYIPLEAAEMMQSTAKAILEGRTNALEVLLESS